MWDDWKLVVGDEKGKEMKKGFELFDKIVDLESELVYFSNTCEDCREFDKLILSILSLREASEQLLAFLMRCEDKKFQEKKSHLKQCVCRHQW